MMLDFLNDNILICVISILLYIVMVFFSKILVKKFIIKKISFKGVFNAIKTGLLFLLSCDYAITKLIKNNDYNNLHDETKNLKGELIKKFNFLNIIITVVLMILSIIVECLAKDINWLHNGVLCFVFVRFFSRAIEIVIAFIIDIIDDKEKTTNLKSKARLSLAFTSLLEVTMLAISCIYFVKSDVLVSINEALSSLFFDFSCNGIVKLIQLVEAINFYALMTLYFSSLIDSKKN